MRKRHRKVEEVGDCQVCCSRLAALPPGPSLLLEYSAKLWNEVYYAADHQEHGLYQQQGPTSYGPALYRWGYFRLCLWNSFGSLQMEDALHCWSTAARCHLVRYSLCQGREHCFIHSSLLLCNFPSEHWILSDQPWR